MHSFLYDYTDTSVLRKAFGKKNETDQATGGARKPWDMKWVPGSCGGSKAGRTASTVTVRTEFAVDDGINVKSK